jgi:lipoic acid synthetase
MIGLGESEGEIFETIRDLRDNGCTILTIGQYLKPTPLHMEPVEYILPEKFAEYRNFAMGFGFKHVESSPLVRSSYHAERHVM